MTLREEVERSEGLERSQRFRNVAVRPRVPLEAVQSIGRVNEEVQAPLRGVTHGDRAGRSGTN